MSEQLDYQDILQEHFNLFSRNLVPEDFLEQLISENVLSIDDKEVITNPCVYQNRRQRANKLIEILMTRGEHGYQKFIEILEYHYPHVYQEVTKKQPRDPPSGFARNRFSDRLRMIQNLPLLLDQMKLQVTQNSEIESQLCVLQQLLEVSKDENAALEKEVEMLKNIRHENYDLRVKLKKLETEKYEKEITINTWMTKAFQLMEAQNEHRDKCLELQTKYDTLYKQHLELEKRNSSETISSHPPVAKKPSQLSGDHGSHIKARMDILEQELESYKAQCEELTARMFKATDNVQILEETIEKLHKEHRKLQKENKTLNEKNTDVTIKNESYYKTIQKKNDEVIELQNRSMLEQQRSTELIKEKKLLFEENHRLEQELLEMKSELEKIKARLSGSSQEFTGSSLDQESSGSDAEQSEDNSPIVHRKIQRRKVVKKGYMGEKKSGRDEKLSIPQDAGDVSYKANTLPAKAGDSPEKLFQREVAHFRYTRKREMSESMKVNTGSYIDTGGRPESVYIPVENKHQAGEPVPWEGTISQEPMLDITSRREAIVPVTNFEEEVADNESTSTCYIPRTSGQSDSKYGQSFSISRSMSESSGASLNKKGKLGTPTGGKRYRRVSYDTKQSHSDTESTHCYSIISQSDSSSDSNVVSDFSSHDVDTTLLPKDCLIISRPGWTDKNMSRQVKVKYSNIRDKVEFKGGNHTGIFITKANRVHDLNEGEQIKGIIFTPGERINPVRTSLKGCTLENFYSLVRGDLINKKKEKEIILEVRTSKQEYESACEWMTNNNGHGDFVYIRCNTNIESKKDGVHSLKPRDIFLVQNSCYDEHHWQGHVVDPTTGKIASELAIIPNRQQATLCRVTLTHSISIDDEEKEKEKEKEKGKRGGFKVKGHVYDRVLPMKASTKLPVDVIGPDTQLVTAVLELISANLSQKFIIAFNNPEHHYAAGMGEEKELYRHDMHIVQPGKVDSMKVNKAVKRITVFIAATAAVSLADTRKLFGDGAKFEITKEMVSRSEAMKHKLLESGYHFEEISIPSVNTKDSLLRCFQTCIETSQNRILWLSCSEMDDQVADQFPTYLGQLCDLTKITAELHHSQNSDHS